jgi:hypothetical protein
MFFTISLYVALAIFGLGFVYKISTWFRYKIGIDAETLELGSEAHEMTCIECHSRPQWGFTGYAVAKTMKPIALGLDKVDVSTILYPQLLGLSMGINGETLGLKMNQLPVSGIEDFFITPEAVEA